MTLLKELVGLETVVCSSIVKTVKRGCVKAAGDKVAKKGKKERSLMTLLKELVGLDTVVDSSIVKVVKRGCVKAAGTELPRRARKKEWL